MCFGLLIRLCLGNRCENQHQHLYGIDESLKRLDSHRRIRHRHPCPKDDRVARIARICAIALRETPPVRGFIS